MKILRDAVVPFFDDNHLFFYLHRRSINREKYSKEESIPRNKVDQSYRFAQFGNGSKMQFDTWMITFKFFESSTLIHFQTAQHVILNSFKHFFGSKMDSGKTSPLNLKLTKSFKNGSPNQATSGACRTIQIHLNNVGKVDRKPLI